MASIMMRSGAAVMVSLIVNDRVAGQQIGTMIDPESGVYLQEFWEEGKPWYAVANFNEAPVSLGFYEWKEGAAGRRLLSADQLDPGRVMMILGADLREESQLILVARDTPSGPIPLGRMPRPALPLEKLGQGTVNKKYVNTYYGLNGSRTGLHRIWFVQTGRVLPASDGMIALTLNTLADVGKITLSRVASKEFRNEASVEEASCSTLPVKQYGAAFLVDTDSPLEDRPYHRIELRLKPPDGRKKTMVVLNARLNQVRLTRGILIDREGH